MSDRDIKWEECPVGRKVEIHLAAMTSRMEDVADAVDEVREMLQGNGKMGLKAEVKVNSVRVRILFAVLGATAITALGALLSKLL